MTEKHSPLLPCPFCGQPAVTHEWKDSGGKLHIECGNDDACPVTVDIQELPAAAVAAWNTRAVNGLPEAIAALEKLILAYVNLLEIGRDRIVTLGGDCDPVDVMEAGDPALRAARAALAKAKGARS